MTNVLCQLSLRSPVSSSPATWLPSHGFQSTGLVQQKPVFDTWTTSFWQGGDYLLHWYKCCWLYLLPWALVMTHYIVFAAVTFLPEITSVLACWYTTKEKALTQEFRNFNSSVPMLFCVWSIITTPIFDSKDNILKYLSHDKSTLQYKMTKNRKACRNSTKTTFNQKISILPWFI